MFKGEIKRDIFTAILCIILGLMLGYSLAYGQLESKVSELSSEKDKLSIQYKELFNKYNESLLELSTLQKKYEQLRKDHSELKSEYKKLNETYAQLKMKYELLESTSFMLDGLKITDLKIDYGFLFDKISGKITNISNESMSKVYILYFEYSNEGEIVDFKYEVIEHLAPNETNPFEFSVWLSLDESFRIFAIGSRGQITEG